MTHRWDPDGYLVHADERRRPFVELLLPTRAARTTLPFRRVFVVARV